MLSHLCLYLLPFSTLGLFLSPSLLRFSLPSPSPTAQTEDELIVSANDKVVILQDLGDGWLRVRKGNEEGYIPQSYVNISG